MSAHPRPRPAGGAGDSPTKRIYLGMLDVAQRRYDAGMKRPRRFLRAMKGRADQLIRAGSVDEGAALIETAFARFEKARQRSERNRDRIRRRAGRWLQRQREPEAFRQMSRASRASNRAVAEQKALLA